jgi:hypothetical protein
LFRKEVFVDEMKHMDCKEADERQITGCDE